MKQKIAILLPGMLLAVAVMAQSTRQQSQTESQGVKAPQSMPTVEQILDRHVQAIGGATAWGKLTSRITKITVEFEGSKVTGSFERYEQAPNRDVLIGQIKADQEVECEISQGFNGAVGWSFNVYEGGFRELDGIELAAEKREAEFYRELKLKELYPKMALKGQVEAGGHTVYRIEATPPEGMTEIWYFDTQTGLLVLRGPASESANKAEVQDGTWYEDYREVDGVKLPFTIRTPRNKQILKVNEVRHNIPIEEVLFNSPGAAFEALSTFKARRSGPPPAERGVLYFSLESIGDQISIRAELDGRKQSYTLANGAEIAGKLRALWLLLQKEEGAKAELNPLFEECGAAFFTPITTLLNAAAEIQFIITGKFLIFPLDLLHFKGRPLFLQMPVAYSFERMESGHFPFSPPRTAVIIEDRSINPERCCQILKDVLPSSDYYNMEEMNLARLSALQSTDLLLISVHGKVGIAKTDYMKLGKERLQPEHLANLAPKLVYLDSCSLGSSAGFIQSFRERGTKFYLAPLVANEAGNSSTKTIAYFFERLKAGDTPARALFFTRRKLYEVFGEKEGFAKLLNRAFPFRVYLLN